MFFVSLLESNFKCKSLFQEIIYLSSTKSTTNELWNYYNNNPKKYLVITDNQTAGKGRGINSWFSVAFFWPLVGTPFQVLTKNQLRVP